MKGTKKLSRSFALPVENPTRRESHPQRIPVEEF
jgi:hypothetical protein